MAATGAGRRSRGPHSLHERALGLLAVRPRSRHELASRLRRAGFEPAEVAEELDRLEAVGLLDDGRFAQEFAEHELDRRLSGRRAVAEGLASKGIDRATIARVLAEIPGDEEERAARLAATRATSLRGLSREVAFRRLVSFLVRRGHDPELARRVCRTVLGADQDG